MARPVAWAGLAASTCITHPPGRRLGLVALRDLTAYPALGGRGVVPASSARVLTGERQQMETRAPACHPSAWTTGRVTSSPRTSRCLHHIGRSFQPAVGGLVLGCRRLSPSVRAVSPHSAPLVTRLCDSLIPCRRQKVVGPAGDLETCNRSPGPCSPAPEASVALGLATGPSRREWHLHQGLHVETGLSFQLYERRDPSKLKSQGASPGLVYTGAWPALLPA